ncbi:MAG TPA: DUF2510 domain-containing protein [Acidimicrobiales bacterium]|nr:DUF2510 domain-containing protein [Acidimicrobiales bacterium]
MFEKRKAAKAAAETEKSRAALTAMIAVAEGRGGPDTPLRTAPGERAVYRIDNAGLFESRRGPGQWSGRSSGVSVPVGMGVRVRVGQSRGHYVQGEEAPTVVDTGTVTFTDRRVVFLGGKYTRAWDFPKVLGIEHDTRAAHTAIQVSNRQKTSGFTYPGLRPDLVAAWLELAMALGEGHRDEVLGQLREQLRQIAPPPPAEISAAPVPAADPEPTVAPETVSSPHEAPPPAPRPAPDPIPVPVPQPEPEPISAAQPEPEPVSAPQPEPAVTAGPRIAVAPEPAVGPVQQPVAAQPVTAGPAAAWYPDPSGAHRLRWWDGFRWTAHVAD